MSGGVDSSVAAALVVQRGYDAVGITLSLWSGSREVVRDRGCCSIDAVEDARKVAAGLGLRHYVWNLQQEFEEAVVAEFENEYAGGRTPNPCVRCNERIKFGVLLDRARAVGATHVATGHYARVGRRGAAWTLVRALDRHKDQSYALHRLDQRQLALSLFPLGALESKGAVRTIAAEMGLATAAKRDSQDLCLLEGSLSEELSRRLSGRFTDGPIVDSTGREVGRHRGLPFYTVGQRSRLGVAARAPDTPPLHVIAIRPADNSILVGPRTELLRSDVSLQEAHWTDRPPQVGAECAVQLRAHGDALNATVTSLAGGVTSLRLDEASPNVTPGQFAVLYRGDEVLGGGIVRQAA